MTIKKGIKYTAISLFSLGFLLFATLIVHIAVMVKGKKPLASEHTQLARIDFSAAADPRTITEIEQSIGTLPGVQSTYYNPATHTLVYAFNNKLQNAAEVYQSQVTSRNIDALKYTVSAADAAKGCPAMDNNSFYGRLTKTVSSIVN
ncbi:hypothetical protein [Edaphocola aurantiacus]|uniref:hypothetical protein n=1 Tax=Edaphocola aurantiacus TaxID=2601682 RepID=UPI001C96BBFC|nr:hypothetical protein [Edaphocola aurantiacus]